MAINLFKITDAEKLKVELGSYAGPEKIKVGNYELFFYYKYVDSKSLKWKNIFEIFNVTQEFKTNSCNGIILLNGPQYTYAISYGNASYVLQKYCDENFAFDFAKRIELKEVKRKSSTMQRLSGQKSVASTFNRTSNIDINSGEILTSLSFTPKNTEIFGNRIDVGKSLKFNLDFSATTDFLVIISNIEEVLEKKDILHKLPVLVKRTDPEEINAYNSKLLELIKQDFNFGEVFIDEMSIIGSSIFFKDTFYTSLRYERKNFPIKNIDMNSIYQICKENDINIENMIMEGKIIYENANGVEEFNDSIYRFLNIDLKNERVTLYEGNWYEYNKDFLEIIEAGINRINIAYYSEYDDILNQSNTIQGLYNEDRINKYISSIMPNCTNIDRNFYVANYESEVYDNKFRIEVADLVINEEEFVAVKQGSDNKAFTYCFEQSELALDVIRMENFAIKGVTGRKAKVMSCWLFMTKIPYDKSGKINLNVINSIMLKRKMCQWSSKVFATALTPLIRINKS